MVRQRKILTTEPKGFFYSKWRQILISTTYLKNDCATWLEYSLGKYFYLGQLSNHPQCLEHVQSPRRNYSMFFFHFKWGMISTKLELTCFSTSLGNNWRQALEEFQKVITDSVKDFEMDVSCRMKFHVIFSMSENI